MVNALVLLPDDLLLMNDRYPDSILILLHLSVSQASIDKSGCTCGEQSTIVWRRNRRRILYPKETAEGIYIGTT